MHDVASVLTAEEQAVAARFRFARDRVRFVSARGQLRQLLGHYTAQRPQDLDFRLGVNGKPAVVSTNGGRPIEFNLSHSEDQAMVAIAWEFAVGIDIEKIRPAIVTAELAVAVFSRCELAAMAELPEQRRVAAFFKSWTSKEAYVKGLGVGLSMPLQDFDVCADPDQPPRLLRPYQGSEMFRSWSLHSIEAPSGYAAALATAVAPEEIIRYDW
jgi:4'-phosphopantetheinyl transferase